ncbi:hypothetical protein Q3G72_025396 [Acer saccharum]|nr:hypothetical protein Q3G72_025396 [Acer saccharum]
MLLETNQSKPIPNLKELPMLWERPKGKQQKQRMPVIVESPSESFSAPKEPLIEDARLAVGDVARTKNNLGLAFHLPINQPNLLSSNILAWPRGKQLKQKNHQQGKSQTVEVIM